MRRQRKHVDQGTKSTTVDDKRAKALSDEQLRRVSGGVLERDDQLLHS